MRINGYKRICIVVLMIVIKNRRWVKDFFENEKI